MEALVLLPEEPEKNDLRDTWLTVAGGRRGGVEGVMAVWVRRCIPDARALLRDDTVPDVSPPPPAPVDRAEPRGDVSEESEGEGLSASVKPGPRRSSGERSAAAKEAGGALERMLARVSGCDADRLIGGTG